MGAAPLDQLAVLGFGLAAIVLLLLGERFLPGEPVALGVVVLSIALLSFTSLGELGFKVVGALPRGLPHFEPRNLRPREVDGLIPLAFACLLLAYLESVSAGRALAAEHRQEIDRARSCSASARRTWRRPSSSPTPSPEDSRSPR